MKNEIVTWEDLKKHKDSSSAGISGYSSYEYSVYFSNDVPYHIGRSLLAKAKIWQIIEAGWGGNITQEEWKDLSIKKFTIVYDVIADRLNMSVVDCKTKHGFPAFRNEDDAIRFMEKNEKLLLEYYEQYHD